MKRSILIIVIIGIVIIGTICILLLKDGSKKDYSNAEIIEISYSVSGGEGDIISTAENTITLTEDGKVTLSNGYNSYTESFNIGQEKYNELEDYIKNRLSLFGESVIEDIDVNDGTTSNITIKLKTGEIKTIGGYMVENEKYNEISNKIYEIVDKTRIFEYSYNIRNM